jgi:hypothetical protein
MKSEEVSKTLKVLHQQGWSISTMARWFGLNWRTVKRSMLREVPPIHGPRMSDIWSRFSQRVLRALQRRAAASESKFKTASLSGRSNPADVRPRRTQDPPPVAYLNEYCAASAAARSGLRPRNNGLPMTARFRVARKPDPESRLPCWVRVPIECGLVLKAREVWPRGPSLLLPGRHTLG